RRRGFVVQEHGWLAAVVEGQVHAAVVVVVAGRKTASDMPLLKVSAGKRRNILKSPAAIVQINLSALSKEVVGIAIFVDVAGNVTVDNSDVEASFVGDIEEAGAEAQRPPTGRSQARARRHIQELTLAEVPEKRVRLAREGSGKEVRQTVAVQIVGVDTHIG